MMRRWIIVVCLVGALRATAADTLAFVDEQIAAHPNQTGVYVLEHGEQALIARAWLANHAQRSIDVQYFIWSTDNIGILAAESVLRAAERGVHVRIVVDDMLVDAPDKSLLALAAHPKIDIRIYNPTLSVGVTAPMKVVNAASDFRRFNQRMHDKTFIVDGKVAITGGRNMAAEYFDYSGDYNFRDRDVLLAGAAVNDMNASFAAFWSSELTRPVEELYGGLGVTKKNVRVNQADVAQAYRELHAYARDPANFSPEVQSAIAAVPTAFASIATQTMWGHVEFLSDRPGKNDERVRLDGGGLTTSALGRLLDSAVESVLIQSPYLVLSNEALELLRRAKARGVRIRISTNSLGSTDNLPAFAGYQSQRRQLLDMGLEIFEFRPDADVAVQARQQALAGKLAQDSPIFGLHAKTMVVDSRVVYVGTYNLDPRSQNLNTEVGAVIYDAGVARQVAAAIEVDMQPQNSWSAAAEPDRHASLLKRTRARLWRLAPIKPLL